MELKKIFEYKVEKLGTNNAEQIEELLNKMSKDNWEYYSVIPYSNTGYGNSERYIFRRAKTS